MSKIVIEDIISKITDELEDMDSIDMVERVRLNAGGVRTELVRKYLSNDYRDILEFAMNNPAFAVLSPPAGVVCNTALEMITANIEQYIHSDVIKECERQIKECYDLMAEQNRNYYKDVMGRRF